MGGGVVGRRAAQRGRPCPTRGPPRPRPSVPPASRSVWRLRPPHAGLFLDLGPWLAVPPPGTFSSLAGGLALTRAFGMCQVRREATAGDEAHRGAAEACRGRRLPQREGRGGRFGMARLVKDIGDRCTLDPSVPGLFPRFRRLPATLGVPWLVAAALRSLPRGSHGLSPVRLFSLQNGSRVGRGPALLRCGCV